MWNSKDVQTIIKEHNYFSCTSFYLYDLDICQRQINKIQQCFKDWQPLYSMKANPNKEIVGYIISQDIGIDAASPAEVYLAREKGCSKDKIFYSSPGKSIDDLAMCCEQCVIIADSLSELEKIVQISITTGKNIRIGIRLNVPNVEIQNKAFEVMSGISSKFGITLNDLSNVQKICSTGNVDVIGLHIYFGSQILDYSVIKSNFLKIAQTTLELLSYFKIEFVNFGGGFGIPYSYDDSPLDIEKLANDTNIKNMVTTLNLNNIKCNLELGRYFVGECGIFCARVEDIKVSFGKKYAILSAGMNGFLRPIFTKTFHKLERCGVAVGKTERITIVGNLCTPIDQYYDNYEIDTLEIGDWVFFHNAGAYGYSMSIKDFISHKKPLEIIIDRGVENVYFG